MDLITQCGHMEYEGPGYICEDCRAWNYRFATAECIGLGFPPLDGSEAQIGYGNVLRLKLYRRLGITIMELITNETDAAWWGVHRHVVQMGKLTGKLGKVLETSRRKLADPVGVMREELLDQLDKARKERDRERERLEARVRYEIARLDRKVLALEIELSDLTWMQDEDKS